MDKYLILIAIILVFLFFISLGLSIILKKNRMKKIKLQLEDIANKLNYHFTICNKQEADYSLENDELIVYLKVINVPSNALITVNSKHTWNLQWGSVSPGKVYPNNRYLNELIPFLKREYEETKKVIKVVLIYKTCKNVMKYLNESEIAIVNIGEYAWGTKAICYNDLNRFEELI